MNTAEPDPAVSRSLWARLGSHIGLRLGLGFGLLCLLMAVMAANTLWQTRSMQRQFTASVDTHVEALKQLQTLARDVFAVNLAARDALLAADPGVAAAALARIEAGRTGIGEEIQRVQEGLKSGGEAAAQAGEELGNQSSAMLVDTRTRAEFEAGHIPGARSLDGPPSGYVDAVERMGRYMYSNTYSTGE